MNLDGILGQEKCFNMCNRRICIGHTVFRTVHQSRCLKHINFYLHVHEFGRISVIIQCYSSRFHFLFFFDVYITTHFAVVSIRHRVINVEVPNKLDTHVSTAHSVSDAVSLVL